MSKNLTIALSGLPYGPGSNDLYWDNSTTRLGIGTTSPAYNGLHVISPGNATYITSESDSGDAAQLKLKNTEGSFGWITDTDTLYAYDYNDGRQILTLDGGGKVGIGTETPSNKLHIAIGDSTNDNYRTGVDTPLIIETAGDACYMQFVADANQRMGIVMGTTGDTARGGVFYDENDGGMTFKSGGYDRAWVTPGGYLGIGTSAPDSPLHVVGTTNPYILVTDTTHTSAAGFVGADNTTAFLGSFSNHPLSIRTNNDEKVRILSNGNVGIGTEAPNHELTVVGDISATGTIHGTGSVSKYVADWATSHGSVTVANEAQLTITHNLGTRDFTTSMWVNVSAGDLNAQEIVGFEGQDSVYEVGANVVNIIDENSCHVQLGKHGYGDVGHASGNHAGHGVGDFGPVTFASKYMKIVIIG